jgi:hypothetical protein
MKTRSLVVAVPIALLLAAAPARATAAPLLDRVAAKAGPLRSLLLRRLEAKQAKLSARISRLSQARSYHLQKQNEAADRANGYVGLTERRFILAGNSWRLESESEKAAYNQLDREVGAAVVEMNKLGMRIRELKLAQ